jgi:antitoxin component YwqK of YwqJK toxin-antitoxin module
MEKSYKNGKQHGVTKVYYENGELGAERIFQNGKIKSIHTYKDGRIIDEKTFK